LAKENEMKTELGMKMRDRITGFTGIATGRAEYISGCHQVLLNAKVKDDGSFTGVEWFDEQRLEVDTSSPPIKLDNGRTPGADRPAPKR
jgi:hypothetical protein